MEGNQAYQIEWAASFYPRSPHCYRVSMAPSALIEYECGSQIWLWRRATIIAAGPTLCDLSEWVVKENLYIMSMCVVPISDTSGEEFQIQGST